MKGAEPCSSSAPDPEVSLAVDDHIVEPEVSGYEVVNGRRIRLVGADYPHATRHGQLAYVLGAKAIPGYEVAVDMQTRQSLRSDFAPDASVVREGVDDNGRRHLEELAFEIVSTQSRASVTERAQLMARRGVRRIFALFLKRGEVAEWSANDDDWQFLGQDGAIRDRLFVEPVELDALLHAAAADDAVATALEAKGNRAIAKMKDRSREEGREEGRVEGRTDMLLELLRQRGLEPSAEVRARVASCADPDKIVRWFNKALVARSADEVVADD